MTLLLAAGLAAGLAGCGERSTDGAEVVVYTAVDEPVARPILQAFERQTGIRVVIRSDTEATKTAGLAERLEAEKNRPQADVWWGNEVFHTIRLAGAGVLAPYDSPSAADIPPRYRDAERRWAGTALRARVIAVSEDPPAADALAAFASIRDLVRPALKGRICMARPSAGTTGGHMAALYTLWGAREFESFLQQLKANDIRLLGGNSVVAEQVGRGTMWAGLTDNDDVDAMLREGGKLKMLLPDQAEGQIGTLTIPCTVGLVAGAPHPEAAKKLVDHLLSREVERQLLDAKFARYSVFADVNAGGVRAMEVDYRAVAANLKPAVEMALRVLEGR